MYFEISPYREYSDPIKNLIIFMILWIQMDIKITYLNVLICY